MKPNAFQAGLAAVLVVIAVVGFLGGRALHSEDEGYTFDLEGPAYDTSLSSPGLSKGGFSGFGETAGLPGSTLLSGKVVSASTTEIVIEDARGARTRLRLANAGGINRIEATTRDALTAGASVVVRHAAGSDTADAILLIEQP